jgi:hypothetical protein
MVCKRYGAGDPMNHKSRERLATEEGQARYAHYFQVGHNAFEVVLEFGQHYEGSREPQIHTRIVATPTYAKAFLGLLSKAMAEYERTFGELS